MSKPVITRRHNKVTYQPTGDMNIDYGRFSVRSEYLLIDTYEGNELHKRLQVPCRVIYFGNHCIGVLQHYKYTKALVKLDHRWILPPTETIENIFISTWNPIFKPTGWVIGNLGWELSE